ncbi:MAG: hypothetical protein IM606_10025 [Cytophagales bacterium]|jgi:hypothetical protein|nr:hypothetical protein [Cytophagales bacterium]
MNIQQYLKKIDVTFYEAGKQLNIQAEALRAYSTKARYANPEIQELIIEWSNGEISKESFKKPHQHQIHIVSEPLGELPKSKDLLSFMLNTFGDRVRRTANGYMLDGRPIQTKDLYQKLQDLLVRDGSNIVIEYPGVVRRCKM